MQVKRQTPRSGQALVMVTVSLIAMSGLIGMTIDLGWSYFVRRAAQTAADAAALAAVNAAMDAVHNNYATNNTPTFAQVVASFAGHGTPAPCAGAASGYLQNACQYAAQNGFSSGGANGAQQVTVASDTTSPPPTAHGVNVECWVTVRITNTIPQLFSAILGNPNATVATRATAAIVNTLVDGSVIALDRGTGDGGPNGAQDVVLASNSKINNAPNGILISSTLPQGAGTCTGCTHVGTGPSSVPYTFIRSASTAGSLNVSGGTWVNNYQNQPDGPNFYDPMRDLGQPPLTSTSLSPIPVPGGNLTCGTNCPPGVYFATSGGNATGGPITVSSNVSFTPASNGFGDYVFFGGLNVVAGTVTLAPGRYVMAGVNSSQYPGAQALSFGVGATIQESNGTGPGEVFILTDSSYGGQLDQQRAVVNSWVGTGGTTPWPLQFGQSTLSPNTMTVHGLNPSDPALPTDQNAQGSQLSDFGNLLLWQDQRFSDVTYTANGEIATSGSCGGGGSLDSPCPNNPPTQPMIQVGPGQGSYLYGRVYQPRGAFLRLLPDANLTSRQLITGALDIQSRAVLNLLPLSNPPSFHSVALVE